MDCMVREVTYTVLLFSLHHKSVDDLCCGEQSPRKLKGKNRMTWT